MKGGLVHSLLVLLALSVPASSQELESDRQDQLCSGMEIGQRLPNGTYVDCFTAEYAIEVDFSDKWAEAIGQSLMYAAEMERLPGIILICREATPESVCRDHGYRIEQTVNWWRIGMTVWYCAARGVQLAQCQRVEYMQEGSV